jgi:hypothetical protein
MNKPTIETKIGAFIRVVLTLFLICVVWQHSHWSVALYITLNAIGIEIIPFIRAIKSSRYTKTIFLIIAGLYIIIFT